jgi:hypothetical protein
MRINAEPDSCHDKFAGGWQDKKTSASHALFAVIILFPVIQFAAFLSISF